MQQVNIALQAWKQALPAEPNYEPLSDNSPVRYPPPNIMYLHCMYYALIILLHRPFISDGHLRFTVVPEQSWKQCTSAARSITNIALAYQTAYTLTSAPYLISYTIYVRCTIHVRNAAAEGGRGKEHTFLLSASLQCLEELCSANPGVAKPVNIIKRLMAVNKLNITAGKLFDIR